MCVISGTDDMTNDIAMVRLAKRFVPKAISACALAALVACAGPDSVNGVPDPHEPRNRRIHDFNIALDRAVVGPVAESYGTTVPRPSRKAIANFASNLGLPGTVVNNLLQLDPESAVQNSFRFALNTTFGLGGVLDVSTGMGLPAGQTGFGETLHVWGVPEGRFHVIPVIGPSTGRHLAGRVVDMFANPLGHVVPSPENYIVTGIAVTLSGVDSRYEYSSAVEAILYESEDSYAQTRRLYLDSRRFQLGVGVSDTEADEIDALFGELYDE